MKKILLGILLTSFLAYGGDPTLTKQLKPNIVKCYKDAPGVYYQANRFLNATITYRENIRNGTDSITLWNMFTNTILFASDFRGAIIAHCDEKLKRIVKSATPDDTIILLYNFAIFIIDF